MKCPLCSREQDADAVFCTACGKKIPRCPACGTVLYKRSRFCVVDGTPLPENLFAGFPPEPEQTPAAPRAAGSAAPPARPASLTILFSSGETQTVTLQDVNGPQDIVFPAPVETASITLVISSVYSGSKYTDTAVSEISFY